MHPQHSGYATAADKKRIEAFIRRGVRLGLYHANDPTPAQLAINSDDKLFSSVLTNSHHVLKQLLTRQATSTTSEVVVTTCLSLLKLMTGILLLRQLFRDSY